MEIKLHKMAKTTPYIRKYIQTSSKTAKALAKELNLNVETVTKWRKRTDTNDLTTTRHNLNITLSEQEELIIEFLRTELFLSVEDIVVVMQQCIRHNITYGVVYRSLKRKKLSTQKSLRNLMEKTGSAVIEEKKQLKFNPQDNKVGFIHIDVKYIKKSTKEEYKNQGGKGKYHYLYVAIDRGSRYVYMQLKDELSPKAATNFLTEFKNHFPHKIDTILTDNGGEFTDRFSNSKIDKIPNKPSNLHPFDAFCKKEQIERRYIRPKKPQTNGMVERFNRRVADWMRKKPKEIKTFEQIEQFLKQLTENYNHTQLKALNHKYPIQVLNEYGDVEGGNT